MAVPKLDSTPSIPILPKIEVKLANAADKTAYMNQDLFCVFFKTIFFMHLLIPPHLIEKLQSHDKFDIPLIIDDVFLFLRPYLHLKQ